ncbi:MAG: DUF1553 domain-containing protein, partial [Planctomycetales bacterium]
FADTRGYQNDGNQDMHPWRDWVIAAFNRNMRFDQFTIEQLAGDLLPGATLDQQIASGFNRNHRGNGEGGIIPEEYAVEYVVDRVETTYTVWMGLTMGCGRCHDHKFDPLSQRDFYRSFAFFNNLPEYGRANKYGNSPPFIKAPTRDQAAQVAALDARLEAARAEFERHGPALAAAQADWERQIAPGEELDWTVSRSELFHAPLDAAVGDAAEKSSGSWKEGTGEWVPGRVGPAARFDGARFLDAGDQANFTFYEKFTLSAWIHPQGAEGGTILSRMTDVEQGDGYSLVLEKGKLQLNLVKRWLDDALRVETEAPLAADEWHHVLVSYDGSRLASGIRMFVDGRPAAQTVNLNLLNQPFGSKEPLRIGAGHGPRRRFRGLIDDVRIYGAVLTDGEALALSAADSISRIAAIRPDQRSAAQSAKLRAFFLDRHAPAEIRAAHGELRTLSGEREQLWDSVPTTMVMQELPQPRPAFVLVRGEYNKPGEPVTAALPGCLPAPPAETRMDRLGFARWLVDPGHPLTSRVAVNRMWQMLFGTGLVKTVDDFGAQGEWPSHPELLDWLAVEFMAPEGGGEPSRARSSVSPADPAPRPWDIKRLLRMILLSATYRQSSRVAPDLWQRDPDNRLLARGPRLRLPAEMVRDQALYASGLLVERVGGPSVKPYQPEGLWKELADVEYVQDHGESLYRRGMYTFWKRTVPPPTMITFDSAGRETCIVRETRTNTPLQALTLMNDVTFVEASRALAERAMHETDGGPDQRLTRAFRLVVSRRPTPTELAVLRGGWESQRERFAQDRAAAEKLLSQGEAPRDQQLDPVELAAYTTMAGVILNLDEAITKE